MKNKILALFFLIMGIVPSSKSQTYYPYYRDVGAKYAIDSCKILIAYEFSFTLDTITKEKCKDICFLEIGNNVTRYYSYYADRIDSAVYNYYSPIPRGDYDRLSGGIAPYKILGDGNDAWYYDIYTYMSKKERVVYRRFFKRDYYYTEHTGDFKWEISDATDTIMGYNCFEAETVFRGKKWRVWFTLELPYGVGPWKLGGLPGLILKATDDKGLFNWVAFGIESPKRRDIHNYAEKAIHNLERDPLIIPPHPKVKSNRKDIEQMWRRQCLAPLSMPYLEGKDPVVYDMGTGKYVKIDIEVPNKYYPKLELDI